MLKKYLPEKVEQHYLSQVIVKVSIHSNKKKKREREGENRW